MRGIRKYKTFTEARFDMYREMWKKGFDAERMRQFFKDFEEFIKRNNLPQAKILYPPKLYFFKTIKEAQEDERIRDDKRRE